MQPDTTLPDNGPSIAPQVAAHVASLTADQKAAMREQFSKSYSPQEIERVFGPAPAPLPHNVTVQADAPFLSAAEKAQGYTALFKHATDKQAVVAQARADGVNMGLDGKISSEPVAERITAELPKPAPNYKLPWRPSDLPIETLTALDGQYRAAFGAVELSQTEAYTAFDAIQDTLAIVPKDPEQRIAFFKSEGEKIEAAYGEAKAKELVRLHTDWFRRLPEAMQTMLAENYGLHSMRAILTTAHLQQAWLARRSKK
jgi:hypothetical protein